MIGIYKWTNNINNKIYIGQSISIEKRKKAHLSSIQNSNLPLHLAMKKYGVENFSFEVVEECEIKELNEKEVYYIQLYNSLIPNGYNLQKGGQPTRYELYYKFSTEDINFIYDEIKNTTKTFAEIGREYGVSGTLIRYINYGIEYAQDNVIYPIRSSEISKVISNQTVSKKLEGENCKRATITEETALKIIYDLTYSKDLRSVDIAKKYNTSIDVIKDINRGRSWKHLERQKPCRPDFGNNKINLDDALQLIDILQNTFMPIKEIMEKHPKFSYKMIYRINKGENWHQDNLEYPIRKYKILTQKLSIPLVQEISFKLYSTDESVLDLSKEYNVSTQTIYDINSHKAYSYVNTNYPNPIRKL